MTSKEGTNDPETAVSFEGRIFETTQKGFLSVGIAIGSALGIFDTIARLGEPSTSRDIAYAAGLKERYVREWLGAMVTGNIVEVTDDEKYFLPKHRVATLCQEEGGGALPIFCEGIPMICEVYKDMTECFKENGPAGVPLSKYSLHGQWEDKKLQKKITDKPPEFLINKAEIVDLLKSTSSVCELGCGSGAATCALARDFPNIHVHATDISDSALTTAISRAESMQLSNTTFSVHDIASLPLDWSGKFDIIFCINVIHDIARPDLALKEVYRILKDEGVFFMVDVRGHTKHADNKEDKKAPSKYIISLFSCVPISMACEGGWGLGGMWGVEKAMEMLEEAGLECKDTQLYSTSNIVYQCKKKQQ